MPRKVMGWVPQATVVLWTIALVGAAAYGSNSTFEGRDAGFVRIISWEVPQGTPSVCTLAELYAPTGYEFKSPARYHGSWQPPLPTPSSSPSFPVRRVPLVKGHISKASGPTADFQPFNLSLTGSWGTDPRTRSLLSGGYDDASRTEDGNDPPPKPPSPKSLGKRRWDASFDADNEDEENSGSEGRPFDSHANFMTDSDLSARWLRHLRSAISTTPEAEEPEAKEPEDSSSWHPEHMTAITGAAFYLAASRNSDRKRKKVRTSEGESSATGLRRAQSGSEASTSNDFSYYEASGCELSGILPGKTSGPRELRKPTPRCDSASTIVHPATRPISHEELVAEVKGIYAGLVMVEGKCIAVESKPERPPHLSNDDWKALIELHRICFHGHHQIMAARAKYPSDRLRHILLGYLASCQSIVDVINGQEHPYEGSTDNDLGSSNPSPDDPDLGNLGNLLHRSPIESRLSQFGPEVSDSLDKLESITETHTSLSFDMDELLESWNDPPPEMGLGNLLDTTEPLEKPSNNATNSGIEPDEEWLRSFVDLEMCSDDSSDFIPETTPLEGFLSQPELPTSPAPITYTEFGSYIEPYLTVMTQRDQTNERPPEPHASSLLSPNTDTEESQSPESPLAPSPSTSQSRAPPSSPSKLVAPPRKGILTDCRYCHKSFSLSELKKHIKYHTKPVSCPEPGCEYACANDHDLKRHHLTNHGEVQRQKCPGENCKVTFTRRYNLLRHVRKVHGGAYNNGVEAEVKA